MLKAFFKDSAVYGLIRIITSGTSLILLPLYTKTLAPPEYGTVDFLTICANLVYLTVALEIAQGFARYFADSDNRGDKVLYASTALLFTAAAYTLFLVAAFLFSSELSRLLLDSTEHRDVVKVAALSIWGYGLFYLVQNQLRYELKPLRYAIASLTFSLTSIGMALFLLLVLKSGIIGVFLAQMTGNIAGLSIGLYFTRGSYKWTFDWGKCRKMLGFSVPLVLSGIGVFAAMYMDRIAIKHLLSMRDLGIYAAGYRVASIVILAMVGFQMALTPLIYHHHRDEKTPRDIERTFRWFLAMALPLVLVGALFADEALYLLTTPAYAEGRKVVFLLGAAFLFSNMYMFAPGVWIANRTGWVAVLNIGAAILNLSLNYALIPHLGIIGGALSTCISSLTAFIGYMLLGQNLYPIPYKWLRVIPSLCLVLAVGVFTMQHGGFGPAKPGFFVLLLKCLALSLSTVTTAIVLLGKDEIVSVIRALRSRLKTFSNGCISSI